jgi:hypothetical protein
MTGWVEASGTNTSDWPGNTLRQWPRVLSQPQPPAGISHGHWLDLGDRDGRTSLWHFGDAEVQVVLPASEDFSDYAEVVEKSLRVVAYIERRSTEEVLSDLSLGGADTQAGSALAKSSSKAPTTTRGPSVGSGSN